jgi:hypothetical protein
VSPATQQVDLDEMDLPAEDLGVRQSLEQKVGLSPSDSAFREQTDKVLRSSEPVPS